MLQFTRNICLNFKEEESEDPIPDDLHYYWTVLQNRGEIEDGIELADYLGVDDNLQTGETPTLAEIAQACSSKSGEMDEESSDDDIEEMPEPPPMTAKEARALFSGFQRYVERTYDDPEILKMCDKFEDIMAEDCIRKMKQSRITDFFHLD
jgi:hypothetical protein